MSTQWSAWPRSDSRITKIRQGPTLTTSTCSEISVHVDQDDEELLAEEELLVLPEEDVDARLEVREIIGASIRGIAGMGAK